MKVLLTKDVHKLGLAGDVKKVANGYGRNYLIPQGLAMLATPESLKHAERIREQAEKTRAIENVELSGIAGQLSELRLVFPAKAGETGKLYGSVTTQMISNAIQEELDAEIDRRQIDSQPIRTLGVHQVTVRLTIDLVPEVTIWVHREGEAPETALEIAEMEAEAEEDVLPYDLEELDAEWEGLVEDETPVDESQAIEGIEQVEGEAEVEEAEVEEAEEE